jgi:uncharacterized membrane protein
MSQNRPTNPNTFFNSDEKSGIVKAIQEAERPTSGEIRLHLEAKLNKDVYERAKEIFIKIGMAKTIQRNGVLIYLVTRDRKFAIIGDKGIDDVVPENFWEDIVSETARQFKEGKFYEGVCQAIHQIGEKLKQYFPHQKDDVNELPDNISTGE